MVEHVQLDFTRIDLDRDLSVGVKVEMVAQQPHQAANLRFVEIGWRPAAPVQLADLTAGKQRRTVDNLLLKRIEILVCFMLLAGNDLIAAAEVAQSVTKRDMHVERQRTLRIAGHGLLKICFAKSIGELKGGRV